MNRNFLSLYSMQFFYIASHVFGWTLSTLYFLNKGYSFLDIALYFALSFITSVLLIMAVRSFRSTKSMRIGLLLKIAVFLAAAFLIAKPMIFAIGIIWGIMTICYWMPLNVHFFKFRTEGKNAMHSGIYFLMWPVLGALLPAAAGIAANSFGMLAVLLSGAVLLVPAVIISLGIKEESSIEINFRDFIGNTKGVKTILFLQGIWEGVDWVVVPIVTFAFIPKTVSYGTFYSYLGVFGVAAFLLLARVSDRIKKRAVFLYPVTAIMAAFTILSGLSASLLEWGIYRGAVSFLVSIFSPFALTVVVDVSKNIPDTMISREFFLNFGRASGALIVASILLFWGNIKLALVASGLILLLHPLFLAAKKKWYRVDV